MQSLHELEDEVIECGRVLDGWNEGYKLTLDLASTDALGRVKVRDDGSIKVQQCRLKVEYLN